MEQSDNMLLTSIKQYIKLPEKIQNLSDIHGDEVQLISFGMLEHLKVDINQVKGLWSRSQKFRAMAKLSQHLYQQFQTQFQLNQLMNPTLPFLRKFMLAFINKIGSGQQQQRGSKKGEVRPQQGKNRLKQWVGKQWIHPSLALPKKKYKGYLLPVTITKGIIKNQIDLTGELDNLHLSGSTHGILSGALFKHNQRVKQFQANQGLANKQRQEGALRLQTTVRVNQDDWNIAQNKLQKIKKKAVQQKQKQQQQQRVTIFQQQLQQAEIQAQKKKINQEKPLIHEIINKDETIIVDPLQLLKIQAQKKRRQYQIDIRDMMNQLNQRKKRVQTWQKQKQRAQSEIISNQQRAVKLRQETAQLRKKVQKRQTVLLALSGEKDIAEEVDKLQSDIKTIEEQVEEQKTKIQKDIVSITTQSKEKMDALRDLKEKLHKIQSQYTQICQEIDQKQQLKKGVKIQQSGISRVYYHKKISQMQKRWRDTQKQSIKLRSSLAQLTQKTRISVNNTTRVQTQISNFIISDRTKYVQQNNLLKELMGKCKGAFGDTMKILEEVGEVKMQTQEYQMKVHGLAGKNYKEGIQKIKQAMGELKREMGELSKSKNK